MSKSLKSI